MKIDGILLEVIGNTFMSIAEEMGAVLVKSAYSRKEKTAPVRCSTQPETR